MPLGSAHFRHGDLIIRFNVIFPPSGGVGGAAAAAALKKLLPREMDAAALAAARRKRRAALKSRTTGQEEEEDAGGDDGADGGADEEPEPAPRAKDGAAEDGVEDEDATLGDCDINVKLQEAREQAAEDRRCGGGATDAHTRTVLALLNPPPPSPSAPPPSPQARLGRVR